MNTLAEACRKENVSETNLSYIQSAINDTIDDIAFIKSQMDKINANVNIFDAIRKENAAKEVKIYPTKPNAYRIPSFDDITKCAEMEEKKQIVLPHENILYDNRFLFDLSVIGVPQTMVKGVWVSNAPENVIEVQIYDFVDEEGTPILGVLSNYNGRKFTCEIEHLDAAGRVVYREKFNGCYLDSEIRRGGLTYERSEPSQIDLRIHYDGVSYEAGY